MKLVFECPVCKSKKSEVKNETRLGLFVFKALTCGHTIQEKLKEKKPLVTTFKNGDSLYPFQIEGVEFARESGFRCLFADKMGLGKTIQIISAIYNFPDELLPALCIVKASLKIQWLREFYNRAGILCEILDTKSNYLGLPVAITSYDSLVNAKWKDQINPRTLILDECQMIKNHNSKRTQQIRDLIRKKTVTVSAIITEDEKTSKHKRAEMLANDLMKFHGVADRFELEFFRDKSTSASLGMTKCSVIGEGLIGGKILINSNHVETDSETEVIETITHEIAHAITPGAGHSSIWSETSKSIYGDGQPYAWCKGSVNEEIEESTIKHVLAASGTPIKNNALEYFPILNILRPEDFPNQMLFAKRYCNAYMTSYGWKVGGLLNPEAFKKKTENYIIRRETEDVLPDLPKIRRNHSYTMMDEKTAYEHKKEVLNFQDFMLNKGGKKKLQEDQKNFAGDTHVLAYMNRMRHLTGFAKIDKIIDYVEEFLESNPEEKICIFMHHIDVQMVLEKKLTERIILNKEIIGSQILRLESSMDSYRKQSILDQFKEDKNNRVLIAPTLSSGEGLNLQFVNTAILGEREWNPANEEQVEGRFPRPGSALTGTGQSIEFNYVVALGSIDEIFVEIIERKRQYMNEANQGKRSEISWDQSSIIKEVAEKLMALDLSSWKKTNLKKTDKLEDVS